MNNLSQSSAALVGRQQDKSTSLVLDLFLRLLPLAYWEHLSHCLKLRRKRGVFGLPVVGWLMIFQRLNGKGTLWVAVQQVVCGLPTDLIPQPCKRLQQRTISSHTGGYNQARQKFPLEVAEQVNSEVFKRLIDANPPPASRMFILDGSTLLMPHSRPLLEAYPPSRNQSGESHWPIMRIVVAHDAHCGIATRPQWGALNGPNAVSEQGLTEEVMESLPAGAGVIGDQNFGVFSVAWAAQQSKHPVLLRLTPQRAKYAFGSVLCSGTDQSVKWEASRWDRASHPQLPPDASVSGRLIVRNVNPSDGSGPVKLYLFTTLELPADEIIQLYGLRWNVETDLRTLKKTIRLEMLDSRTPEMVAKDLVVAITAYNLVRAVINESARRTQLAPRQYSFSRVQDVLNTWIPYLNGLPTEQERLAEFERMLECVSQCKLYKRSKSKSYPRQVWPRRRTFPPRKANNQNDTSLS